MISGNISCFCCKSQNGESISNGELKEQSEPTFDAVISIWREKMINSQLFIPTEISMILPIWIKFIQGCIKSMPNADADEFYVEMAKIAAQKFKLFCDHGWEFLITDFPAESVTCSEISMKEEDLKTPEQAKDTKIVSPTTSVESINDVLSQIEFLMQLVASSNFNLTLVKTALCPSFKPVYIELKAPIVFQKPKMYLKMNTDDMPKQRLRKHLLSGLFDEFILPLRMANEVTDEFWINLENEMESENSNNTF